jgi:GntR family transcriptional regulator/MocR family aminotransferase
MLRLAAARAPCSSGLGHWQSSALGGLGVTPPDWPDGLRVSAVLARDFAAWLKVVPSVAGLHLCALADGFSVHETTAIVQRAAARGVALNPLTHFTADPARRVTQPGLVIGYGAIPTERIDEGLRQLAECLP